MKKDTAEKTAVKITDKEYASIALDIVSGSEILKREDLKVIEDLKDELTDVFLHTQIFRTRTEMEVSVLNDLKFPTPDAKYWQAVREQNVMFQELVLLSYDYRKKLVEIKRLQRKLGKEKDSLEREDIKIDLEKAFFQLKNMERVAKDRIREIKEWHKIKKELLPSVEYSLKDVNEHQLVSYTKEFIQQYLVAGDRLSYDEKRNLVGKLKSALKVCEERGLLEGVLPENKYQAERLLKKIK